MKTLRLIGFTLLLGSMMACGNQKEEEQVEESQYVALEKMDISRLEEEIKQRSKAVEEDSTGDRQLSAALLEAYMVYSDRFTDRQMSAEYTFRAGEIAMNLNHTADAIKLFTKVFEDYKDYEKRPYALFMKAFVLEEQAANYPEAQYYYKEFIKKFPDHPMAEAATYSLKNIGKSPEELIREFERQDSIKAAQGGA